MNMMLEKKTINNTRINILKLKKTTNDIRNYHNYKKKIEKHFRITVTLKNKTQY